MDDQKIEEIQRRFTRAERIIKENEALCEGLGVPAINELRYVGFHLLRALQPGVSQQDQNEDLEKAKNHSYRSIYDASEMGILYCLDQIKEFKESYREINLTKILPDYLKYLKKAEEAQKFLTDGICGKAIDERGNHYQEAEGLFSELKVMLKDLEVARIEADKERERVRQKALAQVVLLFLTVVSVVLGILTYFK